MKNEITGVSTNNDPRRKATPSHFFSTKKSDRGQFSMAGGVIIRL